MSHTVEYTEKAVKDLCRLDKSVLVMIKSWIDKNLVGTQDPRIHGKALSANRNWQWRYRVGNYRILAEIQDEKVTILAIGIGHRSCVYREK